MARTHTFKGSATAGYGYFAYIEDGQLVIGEDWGREGGIIYRGSYSDSEKYLNILRMEAPKLFNSITQYYSDEEEAKRVVAKAADIGVTYRFKDSRDSRGNGYSGYIKDGKLFLEYDNPRNGGEYFRGSYVDAKVHLDQLRSADPVLYEDIEKYFTKHGVKDDTENLKKKYSFDEETKTILFKVKLHMDNHKTHEVLVRGRFQADVIKKLMPQIPEVLTLQTYRGEVFAVRSAKISAVEFVDEFTTIELRED